MSKILSALLHMKLAKLIPILIIATLTTTASATVFARYYGSTTATVKTPDMQLVAGSDASGGSSTYPSANVTIASTKDYATVQISLFPSAANSPQPATYFTDLVEIKNNAASDGHTISQISISSISRTSANDFGKVSVYYCTAQTDDPATTHTGQYDITSITGGTVFSGTQAIAHGASNYIEIVGYAGPSAAAGDTITFTISITWV